MAKPTILIADYDFDDYEIEKDIIEGAGFRCVAAHCKTEDDVIAAGRDADGVLCQYAPVGARAIDAFTRCKVIARYGTGFDIVDVDAAARKGIQVTNAPNEWCADEVADHAIALWLSAARGICEYDRATHSGEWAWQTASPLFRIRGRVLGLLGFGAIAQMIAERAKGFGVERWAHDPYKDDAVLEAKGVRPVSFDELVVGSDFLILQAPLTDSTRHLFNRDVFKRMKRTALLINTARGPIVEDAALDEALSAGWIAGAALDDLEEEPFKVKDWRPTNPLFKQPRAIITPHAAYYSETSIGLVRKIAASEAVRVVRGEAPRYPVNLRERVESMQPA